MPTPRPCPEVADNEALATAQAGLDASADLKKRMLELSPMQFAKWRYPFPKIPMDFVCTWLHRSKN